MRVWQVKLPELGVWLGERRRDPSLTYFAHDRETAVWLHREEDAKRLIAGKQLGEDLRADHYDIAEQVSVNTAWLIRNADGTYWAGDDGWVDRPTEGIRFAREADARNAAAYVLRSVPDLRFQRKAVRVG